MGHTVRLPLASWRARCKPKLNQTHAGLLAGMHVKRFWQIENGEGPAPSEAEQRAIAKGLAKALREVVTVKDIDWPVLAHARFAGSPDDRPEA